MPHYSWKGINLEGTAKRGTLNADNPTQLKEKLFQEGIALLHHAESKKRSPWFSRTRTPSKQTSLITCFEYLEHLLASGIPLLKSLDLTIQQLTDSQLIIILKNISLQVKKGDAFSSALNRYSETFSPLIIQLITAGEKTGNLVPALTYIITYLKEQSVLKKNLLQAALLPLFTITLAIVIISGILVFIIPQFEHFFSSMDKALPPLTQAILNLSCWLRSWQGFAFLLISIFTAILIKTIAPKRLVQKITCNIPLWGNIATTVNLIHMLHMLSLFLKAGIPLRQALETIHQAIKNEIFKKKLFIVIQQISAGQSMSSQLPRLASPPESELLATFVSIGEQTGKLDVMLDKAAAIFEEKLKKRITLFMLFFQPMLMLIVGLIIALLMIAVYLPLFNLAYSVS